MDTCRLERKQMLTVAWAGMALDMEKVMDLQVI